MAETAAPLFQDAQKKPMSNCLKSKRLAWALVVACGAGLFLFLGWAQAQESADNPLPLPDMISIPEGPFISGSDRRERDYAYTLDEAAYGHSVTRQQGWYENERERAERTTDAYDIMATPVTNRLYARFVEETGHRVPNVSRETWERYGLIHTFERTRRHAWTDGRPPKGRLGHPVVLVSLSDAQAFSKWLGKKTGKTWRLPTGLEWEKAVRGTDGRYYPWGNEFDANLLNSHDAGPFDTIPVGRHPDAASPFGVMDAAGQIFEWTGDKAGSGRHYVRAGSWDDSGCGICRPASRHSRPDDIKHILVGFRLVRLNNSRKE